MTDLSWPEVYPTGKIHPAVRMCPENASFDRKKVQGQIKSNLQDENGQNLYIIIHGGQKRTSITFE
jgi:hypothetical protein